MLFHTVLASRNPTPNTTKQKCNTNHSRYLSTLPPDPYIYRSAHPLIITFHSYGAPLWTYSVEHVILDAVLDAVEHDDHEAINVTTLRYEDVHSRTESAALEMFFRSPMTWDGWSIVVDALQKVFKGVYVNLVFEVAVALTPGKLRYIGPGRLYNPKDA